MTVTLATSKTCGPCMVVKNKLKSLGLEIDIKDFHVAEDLPFFKKHPSIKSVPRLVIENDDGTIEIIQGSEEIVAAVQKSKEKVEDV